ncbi:PTS system mannose/fructose/N-acetylgalactosamine-transporter subunit IIB [Anaerorhabdus sp.]|uniref:PTS system mannose/fructose/N-acetylgalactosamine-transporter subunit IIB n=2 Tax=Anaerorhabdus sp. TaxID=1872524 RepID=UPI002B1F1A07|nr:PTS sugar transporter subunit IIB [Anaerorhabdus sp.]MEA4876096.1 PTS sugar transporter subunit IIB [Anaerorhabdus sp.]
MEIVNVRIDERLIHGQVAAVWTRYLNATRIMVIDDFAFEDKLTKMALKMAVPANVNLSVLSCTKASERLKESDPYPNERIFIIVKGPETLAKLLDLGINFKEINVGNISKKDDSIQIKQSISVTKNEIIAFEKIAKTESNLVSQMVPDEEKIDFIQLLKKANFSE